MSEEILYGIVAKALEEGSFRESQLVSLAGSLVWKIGRVVDEGPVTVRIGLASDVNMFSELPRMRNLADAEIIEAIEAKDFQVEWVGQIPS
tara:strand:+ start:242 stop:514 length:273 start_codon:yes stop_codon:yes gene_type:complete